MNEKRACQEHTPFTRGGRVVSFRCEGEMSTFGGELPETNSRVDELPLCICRKCGTAFVPEWYLKKLRPADEVPKLTAERSLPEWLLALVRRLRTQDNRITGDPLFCVQQKVRIYGIDSAYAQDGDKFVWRSEDWEWVINSPDELIEELDRDWSEHRQDAPSAECVRELWDSRDDITFRDGTTLYACHYQERWEFVTAHFTEAAALEYMDSNSHHFKHGARVYVTSQYRCHEWNAARKFLMELEVPK